jgi:hypothetical protein
MINIIFNAAVFLFGWCGIAMAGPLVGAAVGFFTTIGIPASVAAVLGPLAINLAISAAVPLFNDFRIGRKK